MKLKSRQKENWEIHSNVEIKQHTLITALSAFLPYRVSTIKHISSNLLPHLNDEMLDMSQHP